MNMDQINAELEFSRLMQGEYRTRIEELMDDEGSFDEPGLCVETLEPIIRGAFEAGLKLAEDNKARAYDQAGYIPECTVCKLGDSPIASARVVSKLTETLDELDDLLPRVDNDDPIAPALRDLLYKKLRPLQRELGSSGASLAVLEDALSGANLFSKLAVEELTGKSASPQAEGVKKSGRDFEREIDRLGLAALGCAVRGNTPHRGDDLCFFCPLEDECEEDEDIYERAAKLIREDVLAIGLRCLYGSPPRPCPGYEACPDAVVACLERENELSRSEVLGGAGIESQDDDNPATPNSEPRKGLRRPPISTQVEEGKEVQSPQDSRGSRIYVASSWKNEIQPELVKHLRAAGHEVYDFRHPTEDDEGFSWEEIEGQWQGWTPGQFLAALSHPAAVRGFLHDFEAMERADTGVLVLPCGKSAHLEAGYFAGAGKRLFILMKDHDTPELMYKLATRVCTSVEELLAEIEGKGE